MRIDQFLANRGWERTGPNFYLPHDYPHLHLRLHHQHYQDGHDLLATTYSEVVRAWRFIKPHIQFLSISAGGEHGGINIISDNKADLQVTSSLDDKITRQLKKIMPGDTPDASDERDARRSVLTADLHHILALYS